MGLEKVSYLNFYRNLMFIIGLARIHILQEEILILSHLVLVRVSLGYGLTPVFVKEELNPVRKEEILS